MSVLCSRIFMLNSLYNVQYAKPNPTIQNKYSVLNQRCPCPCPCTLSSSLSSINPSSKSRLNLPSASTPARCCAPLFHLLSSARRRAGSICIPTIFSPSSSSILIVSWLCPRPPPPAVSGSAVSTSVSLRHRDLSTSRISPSPIRSRRELVCAEMACSGR